jgi:hypothetical protein
MLKAEGQMELAVLRKHGASIRELARMTVSGAASSQLGLIDAATVWADRLS